jgi:hypothetical protein
VEVRRGVYRGRAAGRFHPRSADLAA